MNQIDPSTVEVDGPFVSRGDPRAIPLRLDWSRGPAFEIDLSYLLARGEFSSLKSIFFDNWNNPNDLRVEISSSSQVFHIPAHSSGCFPVIAKGATSVRLYGVEGDTETSVMLHNNPQPAALTVKPGAVSSGGGGGGSTGGDSAANATYVRDEQSRASLVTLTMRMSDLVLDTAQISDQIARLTFNAGDLGTYDARVAGLAQQIVNLLTNGLTVGDAQVRTNTKAIADALAGTIKVGDADTKTALAAILQELQAQTADVEDLRAKVAQLTFSNGQLLVTGAVGDGGGGTAPGDGSTVNANIIGPLDGNGNLRTVALASDNLLNQILTQVSKLNGLTYNADGGLAVHVNNPSSGGESGGGGTGGGGAITGPLNADGTVAVGDGVARGFFANWRDRFFNLVSFEPTGGVNALHVIARNFRRRLGGGSTDVVSTMRMALQNPALNDAGPFGAKALPRPAGVFAFVQDIFPETAYKLDANCPGGGYYDIDLQRVGPGQDQNFLFNVLIQNIRRLGLVFDGTVHGPLNGGGEYYNVSLVAIFRYQFDSQPPKYYELATFKVPAFGTGATARNTSGMPELLFSTPDGLLGPLQEQGRTQRLIFGLAVNGKVTAGRIRLNTQVEMIHSDYEVLP